MLDSVRPTERKTVALIGDFISSELAESLSAQTPHPYKEVKWMFFFIE
jgi:hypothetical protein